MTTHLVSDEINYLVIDVKKCSFYWQKKIEKKNDEIEWAGDWCSEF